ncbi:MAG: bacillithiol biosynthesis cysteine-adding enzyme BshC [Flavobacteriales bacterium]|nr:bacillithiol biosynthesis cysteine-adding enzyme BshC [Flavobacteriales bacterium]MBP9080227.1 bacillithiol biosynthesis cysteine-adding enzyme BshC [Flavobacteriales bacterium]
MQRIAIPYGDTGRFSPLIAGYLGDAPDLREFYQWRPDRAGLGGALHARSMEPAARAVLCDALERQYGGMEIQPQVRASLDALRHPTTLTVTTGHQLCLFTGPLYVPFKVLNAVRLARDLSMPGRAVVPVFWLATEDHDRPEIDHVFIHGQKVQWPGESAGAVGRLKLQGMAQVLDQVDTLLGPGTHADDLRQLLRRCYRPEHDLARATRLFADALFGRFGVLVLDADDPALKRRFVPHMREELLNQVAARSVQYASNKLPAYAPVQAHARDINLFHLRPGHRSRIELRGEGFDVLDGGPSFSLDELLAQLDAHPERFSPNVLLRPVYQEAILPNIAYVGGGGELAYWFQLKWLFQALQVPMPVLMLRTSAAFISAKDMRTLEELGIYVKDLFAPLEDLRKRLAVEGASFSTGVDEERETLRAFYAAMRQRASSADATLAAAVEAMEARALHQLDHLAKKLVRTAKRQQELPLERLARVHGHLFPGGGLQERRENFMPWYAREGPGFFDRLLADLDPLDPHFSVLPA